MPLAKVKPAKSFDWKVHIFNKKTGRLEKEQHYTLVKNKNGEEWVERDGKRFNMDGSPFAVAQKQEPVKVETKKELAAPTIPTETQATDEALPKIRKKKVKSVSTDSGHSE